MVGRTPKFGKGNCCKCGNKVEDVPHLKHKNICRECYHIQCRSRSLHHSVIKISGDPNVRRVIQHFISIGIVEPLPCQVCHSLVSCAHHPDYTKPLLIEWLCYRHHRLIHLGEFFDVLPVDYSKDDEVREFCANRKNYKHLIHLS